MAEAFLSLHARERADILRTVAAQSGRPAIILEKDYDAMRAAAIVAADAPEFDAMIEEIHTLEANVNRPG